MIKTQKAKHKPLMASHNGKGSGCRLPYSHLLVCEVSSRCDSTAPGPTLFLVTVQQVLTYSFSWDVAYKMWDKAWISLERNQLYYKSQTHIIVPCKLPLCSITSFLLHSITVWQRNAPDLMKFYWLTSQSKVTSILEWKLLNHVTTVIWIPWNLLNRGVSDCQDIVLN